MLQNFAVIAVRNSTPTSKPPSTCHGAAILFNPRTFSTNPHTSELDLRFHFWVLGCGFPWRILCVKPNDHGRVNGGGRRAGLPNLDDSCMVFDAITTIWVCPTVDIGCCGRGIFCWWQMWDPLRRSWLLLLILFLVPWSMSEECAFEGTKNKKEKGAHPNENRSR